MRLSLFNGTKTHSISLWKLFMVKIMIPMVKVRPHCRCLLKVSHFSPTLSEYLVTWGSECCWIWVELQCFLMYCHQQWFGDMNKWCLDPVDGSLKNDGVPVHLKVPSCFLPQSRGGEPELSQNSCNERNPLRPERWRLGTQERRV